MNILLATIIGLSFSVRTPNVTPNPLDYEFAAKISKEEGKLTYFLKRDWERELGQKYIDTEIEVSEKLNPLYVGFKYIDKQSKHYSYEQLRLGLASDIFQGGFAFTMDGTMANFTFNKILKKDTFEYKIYIDFTTDTKDEIWNIKSEARKYFNKYVNVFAVFNKEFYNGQVDEQYKVGFGVKF